MAPRGCFCLFSTKGQSDTLNRLVRLDGGVARSNRSEAAGPWSASDSWVSKVGGVMNCLYSDKGNEVRKSSGSPESTAISEMGRETTAAARAIIRDRWENTHFYWVTATPTDMTTAIITVIGPSEAKWQLVVLKVWNSFASKRKRTQICVLMEPPDI